MAQKGQETQQVRQQRKRRKKPPARFNRKMQSKLAVTFLIIVLLLFALNGVISYINYKSGNEYTIQVLDQQQTSSKVIPFKRGDITDCNGNILATSIKVYNLILDPKVILSKDTYQEPTVNALVQCFPELKREEVLVKIQEKSESSYVVLLKKLEYDEIKGFQALQQDTKNNPNIKGVWFEEEYERKYPYSSLASTVLGFTYDGNHADWGLEGYYNDVLNGTDGRDYSYVNDNNTMEEIIKPAIDGDQIVSTLDIRIQDIVEKKLKAYNKQIKAKSISVLVMNPNTGAILAMANDETYDLNNPRDLSTMYSQKKIKAMSDTEKLEALNQMWRNECISNTFEPGSTMKPFTVAMALEEGVVKESDTFFCDGSETIGTTKIKCHKEDGHGTISLQQTITTSCNDALMQIGLKTGSSIFSTYQSRFGFGLKTGIDLAGEASGILYSADNISDVTLATNSFGQNFTVNMLQIAAGYCSLVNGGNYYTPHLVSRISNKDGGLVEKVADNVVKQTVTETTSEFINKALRTVVTDGTGAKASIDGYEVGGKTGTAEKLPRGNDEYVLSFIGSVPYDNPKVVCYVVIDTPQKNPDDSGYAAQLFHNIMEEVLPYMNIFKAGTKDNNTSGLTDSYSGDAQMPDVGLTDVEGGYTAEPSSAEPASTAAGE